MGGEQNTSGNDQNDGAVAEGHGHGHGEDHDFSEIVIHQVMLCGWVWGRVQSCLKYRVVDVFEALFGSNMSTRLFRPPPPPPSRDVLDGYDYGL